MIAPAFGGFAQFAPQAAVIPGRSHPAAFYPQPILYWGYPSPPVSPHTTYFGPPPPHIAPTLGPQNQPTLVSSHFFFTIQGLKH